jgi:amino acid adenylation domain-containing protein
LSASELNARLESLGIQLAAEGGRLRVNAPRGSLTEELKAAIAESRDELIALLERRASAAAPSVERIEPIQRGGMLPLSGFQARMWVRQRMEPASTHFNIGSIWTSVTQFAADTQCAAVRSMIERHEILHSIFEEKGGTIGMRVVPPNDVGIELRDLGAYSAERRAELVREAIESEVRKPFDLTSAPAVRFVVCRLGEHEAVTLCIAHHIAVDVWSLALLENEFAALCAGSSSTEPAPQLQFADYAAWQSARLEPHALKGELEWWGSYLSGAPPLSVFAPDRSGSAETTGATYHFDWDAELTSGLKSLVRTAGATIYTALLAASAVVLRWHTGQRHFVLGSPMGARERVELETMIGPFVGLLPIRIDVADEPTFDELLRRARDSMLDAHAHRHVPFEALIEHLNPARIADHAPLYQMAIVQHNTPGSEERLSSYSGGAMHELTWFVREADGNLQCGLEYRADRYSEALIRRIAAHLEAVLRRAVEKPGSRLSDLMQLPLSERRQVTEEFNATRLDVPDGIFVTHFEHRVALEPDAIAVVFEGAELSYSQLNRRANTLAGRLRDLGVGRGVRVALCMERSLELVAALLAVHKAGGAYVPLDPGFPDDRLSFMLNDSGAAVLVTDGSAASRLELPAGLAVLDPASVDAVGGGHQENPATTAAGADPAYVIYTSGSTGRPKGVVVAHGSLLNFLWAMRQRPGLASTDVLAAVTTISFDIAGLEIYLPLLAGARIELISRELAIDGVVLAAFLDRCGATVMQATPSTWRLLIEADWRPGRGFRALCGGESLPPELARILLERVGELWNLYGPTETTIWSTMERVERMDPPISVGRPIGNTQVYILGDAGDPVPVGVPGEIWIGGAGVAVGYHNRPELNVERFVADPFALSVGARLYRTGDLGRWLENGRIEHLGRLDQQVKIRGFRVELGEIEARLAQHAAVRETAVLLRTEGTDQQLVAYFTAASGVQAEPEELRRHLAAVLPEYMLPTAFVRLEAWPLTANGKLDRKALPAPGSAAHALQIYEPPRGELELKLAQIWADVLRVERVGRHDNFFELGGHSLLVMRLLGRVSAALGADVGVAALFGAPTLSGFAERISRSNQQREEWNVVELQPLGTKTPIIAINNAVMYYRLAQKIGTERRFIAVQLFDPANPHPLSNHSLEEIIAEYVRLIRQAQPRGPYILMGLCVAGVIAYEAAAHLRRAGEEVPLVIMADTWRTGYEVHLPLLRTILLTLRDRFRYRKHTLRLLRSNKIRLEEFLATTRLAKSHRLMQLLWALRLIDDPAKPRELSWEDRLFQPALEEARDRHQVSTSSGDVVLLKSEQSWVAEIVDPTMGWSSHVTGQIHNFQLPGWHSHMFLDDPGDALMAERLQPLLERIDAAYEK